MTRKDYIAFAAILKLAREKHPGNFPTVNMITVEMADLLARDNPAFDRYRFYAACGFQA